MLNQVGLNFKTGSVAVIIQARMGSSRLPGKVLLDLDGKPMLAKMIDRVRQAKYVDELIVSTPDSPKDRPIIDLCRQIQIRTVQGSEKDVLSRYAKTAIEVDHPVIVRLTGDCPMSDPHLIDQAIREYFERGSDYLSNCNQRTYPDGLDVEVFSIKALLEAEYNATEEFSREHVTPYLRGVHSGIKWGNFERADLLNDVNLSHIRWTVDTSTDLARMRELFALLPEKFRWQEALSIATRYPRLLGVA